MVKMETSRLVIRDHIEGDIDGLHSLLSDEKVMHYLQDIKTNTLDESKENLYVAIKESKLEKRTRYFFAITMKESGNYVGEIGFTVLIDSPKGKVVEMGYFILEEYWGKGIVTEAAKAVVDYGFGEASVIKFETGCAKANAGSEKVMKKIGMVKEAELKKHMLIHSKLEDRVEYRLLKEEWEKI